VIWVSVACGAVHPQTRASRDTRAEHTRVVELPASWRAQRAKAAADGQTQGRKGQDLHVCRVCAARSRERVDSFADQREMSGCIAPCTRRTRSAHATAHDPDEQWRGIHPQRPLTRVQRQCDTPSKLFRSIALTQLKRNLVEFGLF
jgi:hypothetical protein